MRVRDLRLQPIPGGPGLLCIVEPGFELFKEPCALRRSLRFNRGEGGTGTRCVPVEPLTSARAASSAVSRVVRSAVVSASSVAMREAD